MARIRTIKPEFWVSEQIAECSMNARLTFIGLWNFCDDQGVHPAKPKTLKAELFPMDEVTVEQVGHWIAELIAVGLVVEFNAGDDSDVFWHVTGWQKHQRIDRPSFKYPSPPSNGSIAQPAAIGEPPSNDARRILAEHSSSTHRTPSPGVERIGTNGMEQEESTTLPRASRCPRKTALPVEFSVSDRVRDWAERKGFDRLDTHLEAFCAKARARGYEYADWDAALMEAIRQDWAGLRTARSGGDRRPPEHDPNPPWLSDTGFASIFDAENAGCGPGNAKQFRNGERVAP